MAQYLGNFPLSIDIAMEELMDVIKKLAKVDAVKAQELSTCMNQLKTCAREADENLENAEQHLEKLEYKKADLLYQERVADQLRSNLQKGLADQKEEEMREVNELDLTFNFKKDVAHHIQIEGREAYDRKLAYLQQIRQARL